MSHFPYLEGKVCDMQALAFSDDEDDEDEEEEEEEEEKKPEIKKGKPKKETKKSPKKPTAAQVTKTAEEKEAKDMEYLDSLLKETEKESPSYSFNEQEEDDAYLDIGKILCINKK